MSRRLTSALAVAGAATLAVGLSASWAAQAHQAPAAHRAHGTAARVSIRHIAKYASTSKLPTSKQHAHAGAVNLTEKAKLQRYVNRSNSARPALARRNGRVVMRNSSADSWLPVVKPTPIAARQHPGQRNAWEGLNEYDNGVTAGFSLEPPDQGLCAGNGHVLELINDVVQVYSPTGTPQHAPVYLNDFFNEPGYQFTTDPSCVYDAGSNRFYATQLTLEVDPSTGNLTGRNWLDIAVSKTGNPVGGYNFYRIYTTNDGSDGTPTHTDCPCIGDYPHLGTDSHGLYLTTNEYPFSGPGTYGNNFNGAQLYAVGKHALASGSSSPTVVYFQSVRVPTTSGPRYPGFTLWPAQSAGKAYDYRVHGTMPFLSSFAAEEARPDDFTGHSNQLGLWQLQNTRSLNTSAPDLRLRVRRLTVGDYGIPPLSNQKPGPTPLKDCLNVGCVSGINDQYAPEQEGGFDSSDTRMLTAGYAHGRVYGALDTAMQVSGNVKAGFQWYEVNATVSPSLAGQGYVGVRGQNVTYPAIATNPQDAGYLGVTLAGNNYYPSAAYLKWHAGPTSPVYVSGRGKAPEDGFCEYLYFNCAGTPTPQIRPRWGDYGYAAWDGKQFFVANEWIAHSCTFAMFDADHTCGGTRTFYGNFSTHIARLQG